MDAIEPNVLALIWFILLFAISCVSFYLIVGMFPLRLRPKAAQGPGTLPLIGGNLAALLALTAGTIAYGIGELRWTSLVICGGLLLLFAPTLLQSLPAQWRDGKPGLAALLLVQILCLSLLYGATDLI